MVVAHSRPLVSGASLRAVASAGIYRTRFPPDDSSSAAHRRGYTAAVGAPSSGKCTVVRRCESPAQRCLRSPTSTPSSPPAAAYMRRTARCDRTPSPRSVHMTLEDAIRTAEPALMTKANVVGVGSGERNGTPVIAVLVTRKMPTDGLRNEDASRSRLAGFPRMLSKSASSRPSPTSSDREEDPAMPRKWKSGGKTIPASTTGGGQVMPVNVAKMQ